MLRHDGYREGGWGGVVPGSENFLAWFQHIKNFITLCTQYPFFLEFPDTEAVRVCFNGSFWLTYSRKFGSFPSFICLVFKNKESSLT